VLARFRPVAVPGAPTGAVPADRAAQRAAELDPVFASLDGAVAEAAAVRARAEAQAAAIRDDGLREAEAVLRAARERQAAESEQAVQRARRDAGEYCGALLARSRQRAASIREQAEPDVSAFADEVVDRVVRQLTQGSEPPR
jgi:hypothetical protein